MRIRQYDLSDLKKATKDQIDEAAAAVRRHIITLHDGMPMVYAEKRREAEEYSGSVIANAPLNELETPHLTLEAAAWGISRLDMAGMILNSALFWANISAQIDTLRVVHKAMVDNATTEAAIRAAAQINWPELPE